MTARREARIAALWPLTPRTVSQLVSVWKVPPVPIKMRWQPANGAPKSRQHVGDVFVMDLVRFGDELGRNEARV